MNFRVYVPKTTDTGPGMLAVIWKCSVYVLDNTQSKPVNYTQVQYCDNSVISNSHAVSEDAIQWHQYYTTLSQQHTNISLTYYLHLVWRSTEMPSSDSTRKEPVA